MKIDFVVLWVNGQDKNWLKKKESFSSKNNPNSKLNSNERYRDYDTLKFWFRSVEKYANWVNHIFLITDNQIPEWLDLNNSRVSVIDHKEFLNENNLPVFNSNAIELNIDRISSLSENFVLFNDDTFINKKIDKTIFFKKDKPRDIGVLNPIIPEYGGVGNIINNDLELVNERYNLRSSLKKNFIKYLNFRYGIKNLRSLLLLPWRKFPGFFNPHIPTPYTKSEYKNAREMALGKFEQTSSNKFRTTDDISHWFIRYKRLAEGNFVPISYKIGKLYNLGEMDEIVKEINESKHSLICINDDNAVDFNEDIQTLYSVFLKKLENKSEFEKK